MTSVRRTPDATNINGRRSVITAAVSIIAAAITIVIAGAIVATMIGFVIIATVIDAVHDIRLCGATY